MDLFSTIAIVCTIVVATVILLATQLRKITLTIALPKKREVLKTEERRVEREAASSPPVKEERSIPSAEADRAKEDLRILNLEKEIVGFALTRLYEAEAEERITKDDRAKLLDKYKAEMKELESQINRREMIVRLYELEGTQSELVQMFNNRLNEIGREIESIRASLGLLPKEETAKEEPKPPKPVPQKPKEEEAEKKTPSKKETSKTEAEQKLEAIQEEVLKVLERLEQIETEA